MSEGEPVKCIQCGWCCTVVQCGYGEWNLTRKQCEYLTEDNKCFKYDEIVEAEKDHELPMMGSGCSSPLADMRRARKLSEEEKKMGREVLFDTLEIGDEFYIHEKTWVKVDDWVGKIPGTPEGQDAEAFDGCTVIVEE